MKTIKELREAISYLSANSAWERGVHQYALEMIEDMPEDREFHGSPADMKDLLNGAQSWQEYTEDDFPPQLEDEAYWQATRPQEYAEWARMCKPVTRRRSMR